MPNGSRGIPVPAAFEVVWKRPPAAGPRGAKIPSRGQGWCQPRCTAPARSSPMAKGLGCTWTEQTAHESWGSPAPNWDLVLWGPQEWASQGCQGSSPLAQGGCRDHFGLPKSWSSPSHLKSHPREPCWEPWAHKTLHNGTQTRPGFVAISHKPPAPTPLSMQPRLSQQGKKQFVSLGALKRRYN